MKRHVWVIESRIRKIDGTWTRWHIGEAFSNRADAVDAGCPYKDNEYQVRITRYTSDR